MAERQQAALAKARRRLEAALAAGELYEAQQLYLTLLRRLLDMEDFPGAYKLLGEAVTRILQKQPGSRIAQQLAVTLCDTVQQVGDRCAVPFDLMVDLAQHFEGMQRLEFLARTEAFEPNRWNLGTTLERDYLILQSLLQSKLLSKVLDKMTFIPPRLIYESPERYIQLSVTFILVKCAQTETDLANATCDVILGMGLVIDPPASILTLLPVLNHSIYPGAAKRKLPYDHPLLTFCHYLLQVLARDALPLYKTLRESFKPEFEPTPAWLESLDHIERWYYRAPPRTPAPASGNPLSNLFGGDLRGLYCNFY